MWAAALVISVLYGAFSGRGAETGLAALQGAPAAVEVILGTGGLICLWSGVMEVMRRSGLMAGLSRLLRPVLGRLFPRAARDRDTMDALSANVSANFLGLGNAATPMGIRAAQGMARLSDRPGTASRELCLLVVLNTASIQLLPTTAAALRASAGAASPFDILPAVWLSSAASVTAGLLAASLLARLCGE
jgi:spore maturation protein A